MLIAELPQVRIGGRPAVVAAIGSCRIYQPLMSVFSNSRLKMSCWPCAPFTYSPGESLQYFEFCRGLRQIPQWLWPYVFSDAKVAMPTPALREAMDRADFFVVEISTLDQLIFEQVVFNWNELGGKFVRGQGEALLLWWRELTDRSSRKASPQSVERVLASRAKAGEETPPEVIGLLSEIRFETLDASSLREMLGRIAFDTSKKWTFVSHFNLASEGAEMMPDRQTLLESLRDAAAALGHAVFDPTPLVERFDYRKALRGNGADKHHYADGFNSEIGLALVEHACAIAP